MRVGKYRLHTLLLLYLMWFTVTKDTNLNTNERLIAFYKKELIASHTIDTAKKQRHYKTKRYRKMVEQRFPSSRRYTRMRAIVSSSYRKMKYKMGTLSQLGMRI